MAIPIDVVVFKCRKICPTGNRWNRAIFTWQKISAASQTVATARIAPKICQVHCPPPNNVITVLQISSKSVDFRRSYRRTHEHRFLPRRVFPWFVRSCAYLRVNNDWPILCFLSSSSDQVASAVGVIYECNAFSVNSAITAPPAKPLVCLCQSFRHSFILAIGLDVYSAAPSPGRRRVWSRYLLNSLCFIAWLHWIRCIFAVGL